MKIKVSGIWDDYSLRLGLQVHEKDVPDRIKFLCEAWKPSKAKSYTVHGINWREDLHGHFYVTYFTTAKEGEVRL